jgi:hypothetical protein
VTESIEPFERGKVHTYRVKDVKRLKEKENRVQVDDGSVN